MGALKGSRTEANLRAAFIREAEANRRYLWFAEQADVDGYPDVAVLFRQLAESETGHAFGHLEMLASLGDPSSGEPLETTADFLRSAIGDERRDASTMYPEFAAIAAEEGFGEVATWMASLAKAEGQQLERLEACLAALDAPPTSGESGSQAAAEDKR